MTTYNTDSRRPLAEAIIRASMVLSMGTFDLALVLFVEGGKMKPHPPTKNEVGCIIILLYLYFTELHPIWTQIKVAIVEG